MEKIKLQDIQFTLQKIRVIQGIEPCKSRNGKYSNIRINQIRINRSRINQGVPQGVYSFGVTMLKICLFILRVEIILHHR